MSSGRDTTGDAADDVVVLDRVTRRFGGPAGVVAVDGVSLRVSAGELLGVAGPSGSGKTTLLNLILGWEHPDAGGVERRAGDRHWGDTAVVPQDLGLLEELSVAENVALAPRLAGRSDADVPALLGSLELDALASRSTSELSMGERQRVAVVRAVACGPRLLVADEPTAHQDERRADLVMAVLRGVAAAGGAVVVATHDERLLERVDRVIQLADGRVRVEPGGRDGVA